ncbi:hypothetical protein EVAR_88225_1 [Eumeta japonica]|uniref:Uncharacterized protein n=1 Tax=Eumeta variegata TaxID=151549 RepID=A0A4C1Z3C7_EUMVA|nr:hypothetical protein EVAR_88225_1 [Eumeta japonica]
MSVKSPRAKRKFCGRGVIVAAPSLVSNAYRKGTPSVREEPLKEKVVTSLCRRAVNCSPRAHSPLRMLRDASASFGMPPAPRQHSGDSLPCRARGSIRHLHHLTHTTQSR